MPWRHPWSYTLTKDLGWKISTPTKQEVKLVIVSTATLLQKTPSAENQQPFQAQRPSETLAKAPYRSAAATIKLTSMSKTQWFQRVHHKSCI